MEGLEALHFLGEPVALVTREAAVALQEAPELEEMAQPVIMTLQEEVAEAAFTEAEAAVEPSAAQASEAAEAAEVLRSPVGSYFFPIPLLPRFKVATGLSSFPIIRLDNHWQLLPTLPPNVLEPRQSHSLP